MTDIGTGSYTIIAQTAAEMMGVPLDKVTVRLGDSTFRCRRLGRPWGANSSPSASMRPASSSRAVRRSSASTPPTRRSRRRGRSAIAATAGEAAGAAASSPRTRSNSATSTSGPAVDLRRALRRGRRRRRRPARSACAACSASAPPAASSTPRSARSQVIGAMTMGVGAALMEETRGRQAPRLLRQPRSRRLRGAGPCRHPAPGGDLPGRDRSACPRR